MECTDQACCAQGRASAALVEARHRIFGPVTESCMCMNAKARHQHHIRCRSNIHFVCRSSASKSLAALACSPSHPKSTKRKLVILELGASQNMHIPASESHLFPRLLAGSCWNAGVLLTIWYRQQAASPERRGRITAEYIQSRSVRTRPETCRQSCGLSKRR